MFRVERHGWIKYSLERRITNKSLKKFCRCFWFHLRPVSRCRRFRRSSVWPTSRRERRRSSSTTSGSTATVTRSSKLSCNGVMPVTSRLTTVNSKCSTRKKSWRNTWRRSNIWIRPKVKRPRFRTFCRRWPSTTTSGLASTWWWKFDTGSFGEQLKLVFAESLIFLQKIFASQFSVPWDSCERIFCSYDY